MLIAASLSGDEVADSRRLAREAVQAYQAKNFALYLEKSRAASDLRANHPTLLYNLASALALNGRGQEALDVLDSIAAMGMVLEPGKDDDFASIRNSPRFADVVEVFARNARPTSRAAKAFTIDRRGIISEGLAFDPKSGRFFVSSVRNGAIHARDRKGRLSTVIDHQWGIFGMAVDAKRRRLWATTSAIEQNENFRKEDAGHAAVLEIDLDTDKLIRRWSAPEEGHHLFGDLTVARNGDVYVSDSASPVIYAIRGPRPEARGLIPMPGPFSSLQGLALSPDETMLYAADYAKGIFAIDLATGDAHVLAVPRNETLLGVDGLYAAGKGILVGTQNGTTPQRVIRIRLGPHGLGIAGVDALASNESGFDDITLGVVAGNVFYFNAAGQWSLFGDDGKMPDAAKLKPATVLRLKFEE